MWRSTKAHPDLTLKVCGPEVWLSSPFRLASEKCSPPLLLLLLLPPLPFLPLAHLPPTHTHPHTLTHPQSVNVSLQINHRRSLPNPPPPHSNLTHNPSCRTLVSKAPPLPRLRLSPSLPYVPDQKYSHISRRCHFQEPGSHGRGASRTSGTSSGSPAVSEWLWEALAWYSGCFRSVRVVPRGGFAGCVT